MRVQGLHILIAISSAITIRSVYDDTGFGPVTDDYPYRIAISDYDTDGGRQYAFYNNSEVSALTPAHKFIKSSVLLSIHFDYWFTSWSRDAHAEIMYIHKSRSKVGLLMANHNIFGHPAVQYSMYWPIIAKIIYIATIILFCMIFRAAFKYDPTHYLHWKIPDVSEQPSLSKSLFIACFLVVMY